MAKRDTTSSSRSPHVIAAVLCERVLIEEDNTISVIRIIDRFQLTGVAIVVEPDDVDLAEAPLPTKLQFNALIMVRNFPREGEHQLMVQLYGPGDAPVGSEVPVTIEATGPLRGGNVQMPSTLEIVTGGTYHLSVRYAGRELARSFFEVVDQRERKRVRSLEEVLASTDDVTGVYRARKQ
jgi:hypothetical protein